MNRIRLLIASGILILICYVPGPGQTRKQDVVYLKNGNVIRGTIVELIPEKTVKIETADGSVFVYPTDEVLKMQREDVVGASTQTATDPAARSENREENKGNPLITAMYVGAAFPTGDFASNTGGGATTGFTLGMQIQSRNKIGMLVDLSYSRNSWPFNGSWVSGFGLVGLKIDLTQESRYAVYLAPLIGGLYASTPDDGQVATSITFAYGFVCGVNIDHRFGFGARIAASEADFKYSSLAHANMSISLVTLYTFLDI